MKQINILLLLGIMVFIFSSCESILPKAPDSSDTIAEPIEGLTPHQLAFFMEGDELFAKVFTPDEGLGPIFIQNACEGCHVGDGKGHPFNKLTRFGKYDEDGDFDYMLDQGGPQLQHRSINNYLPEVFPENATHFSDRIAPIVIGMGLLASVDDQNLLDLVELQNNEMDGITGRVNYVLPNDFFLSEDIHIDSSGYYIGRFGKKASKVTLLDQVVFALKQDIGLTSDFDTEDPINYVIASNTSDGVPDPEVGSDVVNRLVFYMRTLKAPSRRNETDQSVIDGEQIFKDMGCVKCHVQTLTTASSEIEALSNKVFYPYTDLLLHDMGMNLSDNYPEGGARGGEWRTPPLWGLGLADDSQGGAGYYLHDGRATSLEQAIEMHGGEAAGVIVNYSNLSQEDKDKLYEFLMSL
ncbi:MAG: di-heme oxidoredictase family protein [Flavobacteriales bacterium]